MNNEAEAGSFGTPDDRGRGAGSVGDGSPFQARAAFLSNWHWQSVVRINQGACARGQAQHGFGSEAGTAFEESWRLDHAREQTLAEALDLLRSYHRRAPFLCVVVQVLDDGRISWRPDAGTSEFIGLPESLRKL